MNDNTDDDNDTDMNTCTIDTNTYYCYTEYHMIILPFLSL